MADIVEQLRAENNAYIQNIGQQTKDDALADARTLLKKIKEAGKSIFDPADRHILSTLARNLGELVFNLSGIYPSVRLEKFSPPKVPFVNRQEELVSILSALAPPYHLIDAPAGYGKTALLRELHKQFEAQQWLVAYIPIGEPRTLLSISQLLAAPLELSLQGQLDTPSLGKQLTQALIEQRGDEFELKANGKKGLVLLIDINQKPWLSVKPTLNSLLTDFIPQIEQALSRFPFFQQAHNRFRVVLAGRYLRSKIDSLTFLRFREHCLTNFQYNEVYQVVQAYLPHQDQPTQLAAHLTHYTAGHLGSMIGVLKLYEQKANLAPDDFFSQFADEIWEIVWPHSDAIRQDIDRGLRRIFDELSIFRYLDYSILQELLNRSPYPEYEDSFQLADVLTKNYLMSWKGRLLQDQVTRRLVALRFLREIGSYAFAWHCQRARNICAAHLEELSTQMPERWAIEYLFQWLQQHTEEIQSQQKRQQIAKDFFEKELSKALQLLIKERNPRAEQAALKRALETDWEFCFTINYYLRKSQYTDEPYRELQQQIDRFFAERSDALSRSGTVGRVEVA